MGGATYSFDVDEKTEKQVAELGLKLILICGAYDLDIEDALEAVHDKGKEQSV
jgi:NTP pyrophosphatase (non-canonical NTP hydrolase)